ncbi:MAG TPA: F0F1 ATP synthase subunit B [Pirellulales bacterium]|jgi:F-type H+-transporting ATPase subunit b|nr:F0F1 ATP synthase subunit B [Pirellulales bacterium]
MSLARIVFWLAVVGGAVCFPTAGLAEDHIESKLERAERELSRSAHTDPSHGNPKTDPLSVDPDLALWTLVVFVVLLAVLWKFAWGPILAGLEKREHAIAHEIADAKHQHEEANALVAKYEARLAAAGDEVRALLDEGRRDAESAKQTILAEAKSAAEAERIRALREIESATDGALRSLAERSAQLAVELAGKIVRRNLTPADHARLVDEAVEKFTVNPSKN